MYNISFPFFPPYPVDPTLTTDNLMEVVKEVEHRWKLLGTYLNVSHFKKQEIQHLYMSDNQRMEAMINEYVRHNFPTPSWKEVATALQKMKLDKLADKVITKYVRGTADVNHVACWIKKLLSTL